MGGLERKHGTHCPQESLKDVWNWQQESKVSTWERDLEELNGEQDSYSSQVCLEGGLECISFLKLQVHKKAWPYNLKVYSKL